MRPNASKYYTIQKMFDRQATPNHIYSYRQNIYMSTVIVGASNRPKVIKLIVL